MAWLDDRAWCHPKLVNLSDKAHRVYVNSLSYSSGMGLKGTLTGAQQKLLGSTPKLRKELIVSGVWDELDGAIRIHDWDDHNSKRDERKERDKLRKREARKRERPQDSPQDVPGDSPHSRRALKEVKEVTSVELANASPTAQQLVGEYVDASRVLGVDPPQRVKGQVARQIGELLNEGQDPHIVGAAVRLMIDRRLHPTTLPSLILEATAGPARRGVAEPKPQNGSHAEVDLNLPELTDEEIAQNKARLKAMTS